MSIFRSSSDSESSTDETNSVHDGDNLRGQMQHLKRFGGIENLSQCLEKSEK